MNYDEKAASDAKALLLSKQSLVLATLNSAGAPEASYTPFAIDQENLLIFVSELSPHTNHLIEHDTASILLIEDESGASNIFARKRLSYEVSVTQLPKGSAEYDRACEILCQRFDQMIPQLMQLPDFHAFELHPEKARWVSGFGRAFVSNSGSLDELIHLSPANIADEN